LIEKKYQFNSIYTDTNLRYQNKGLYAKYTHISKNSLYLVV